MMNAEFPEDINLGGTTQEQHKEFEKSVSRFTERPVKQYLTYDATDTYRFVFFDIETTSINTRDAEICQLSAVDENEKTYTEYVMPNGQICFGASCVNNLTVKEINGEKPLCKNSVPVDSVPLQVALESFAIFLRECSSESAASNVVTILFGHNSSIFDIPVLLRNADASFASKRDEVNIYFGDTLPLIRSLIKCKHSPLQQSRADLSSIYECLFAETRGDDRGDALADALALKKILLSSELAIDTEKIINGSRIHSVCEAQADLSYLDHRHRLLDTFTSTLYRPGDEQSPITKGMAEKMSGSGISYHDLCSLYRKFGKGGVIAVLNMAPSHLVASKKPRVTRNKRILRNILAHLKSNVSNLE